VSDRETIASIVWERIDPIGRESAEQIRVEDGWLLKGRADFTDNGQECRLDYEVVCDSTWATESAVITGNAGKEAIDVELLRNAAGEWSINGSKVWEVTGCDDVDFEFSPSTNALVIRRANLAIGETVSVRAAWVRFPSFALEPSDQIYMRTGESTYLFQSADGEFERELTVDASGFVMDYPGLWRVRTNRED
jgi:hypothetical protein